MPPTGCRRGGAEWEHDLRSLYRHPRGRPRGAARARRPLRRRLPRRPVRGDRGARRRAPPRAGGAAHRLGQVSGLFRRDAAAAASGCGAHRARVTAAGAHARPDRGRRACRGACGRDQLHQCARVDRRARAARPRRGRRPAGLAGEAQQPGLPRAAAAGARAPHRDARRRRGALHQRLGPRFPPRLPAAARPDRADARRCAGAGDHRDGEQPGRGGCGGAARQPPGGWRSARRCRSRAGAHDPRTARAHLAAPRRAAPARFGEPPRVAAEPPRRSSRFRHHLHADRRGCRRHRPPAARSRARRAGLHRADRHRGARRVRGHAQAQRGQGSGRHERTGHGLRQTRSGIRAAPRSAVVSRGVLPAGGSCRPCE